MKMYNQTYTETMFEYSGGHVCYAWEEELHYTYIFGNAEEIKAIYRSMQKAYKRGRFSARPEYIDFPKFNTERMYGIAVSWEGIEPYYTGVNTNATFCVLGEDVVKELFIEIMMEEIK